MGIRYYKQKDSTIGTLLALEVKAYDNKVVNAANFITLYLHDSVKQQLFTNDFDNGYNMLNKLKTLFQSLGETQFYSLYKELFSLCFEGKNPNDFITRIKTLNEQIETTQIEIIANKRALLCLSMAICDMPNLNSFTNL